MITYIPYDKIPGITFQVCDTSDPTVVSSRQYMPVLRYVHSMLRSTQWQSVAKLRGKSCAMPQVYVDVATAWLRHAVRCCTA